MFVYSMKIVGNDGMEANPTIWEEALHCHKEQALNSPNLGGCVTEVDFSHRGCSVPLSVIVKIGASWILERLSRGHGG